MQSSYIHICILYLYLYVPKDHHQIHGQTSLPPKLEQTTAIRNPGSQGTAEHEQSLDWYPIRSATVEPPPQKAHRCRVGLPAERGEDAEKYSKYETRISQTNVWCTF